MLFFLYLVDRETYLAKLGFHPVTPCISGDLSTDFNENCVQLPNCYHFPTREDTWASGAVLASFLHSFGENFEADIERIFQGSQALCIFFSF